jgi:hypothetical protein
MQGMQPGQRAPVPNQRSLDRQDAEANPEQVEVNTNGFGNQQRPMVTYAYDQTFGDGLRGLSNGNGRNK